MEPHEEDVEAIKPHTGVIDLLFQRVSEERRRSSGWWPSECLDEVTEAIRCRENSCSSIAAANNTALGR